MQGLSERQYAERVGLSRGAIQKAKKAGRLVLFPDGSIDSDASDRRRAETTDPSKSRPKAAARPAGMKPVPAAAVAAVGETLREHGVSVPEVGEGATFMKAKTANEVLKAQERRLRLQKLKGELIDRARAETLMFRLARDERDAWVTWPARVAAQMASELTATLEHPETADNGAPEPAVTAALIQRLLETHVRAQLDSLAEIRPRLG
ncbi:hypothetical protein [Gemmobacter nectariphilus]|uniref:hypothetical protein n=1 Tax=Gemmobacter nectariphilus TaxID=220343 RepID=UPI00041C1B43|nr:hypothetical protein [Gemmobacter nectariphilus]